VNALHAIVAGVADVTVDPPRPVSAEEARKQSRRATERRPFWNHHDREWRNNNGQNLDALCFWGRGARADARQGSASAWQCDFLTGGGFIVRDTGANANFGVGGGCKDGSPTWGHLEYIDHGMGLNVHWTSITAYMEIDSSTDDKGRPIGPASFAARPGRTCSVTSTGSWQPETEANRAATMIHHPADAIRRHRLYDRRRLDHTLGGSGPEAETSNSTSPNPSTTGSFGGSCPALFRGGLAGACRSAGSPADCITPLQRCTQAEGRTL